MELGEHRQDEPPVPDCDCRRCAVATRDDLRKDAERYRWLRDMLEKNDAEAYEIIEFAYRGGLTGAIDAAMNGANG